MHWPVLPCSGIGFGAYLAVDFALLTQVLPQAADRGKDMGVINVAASLPQVFAPTLAFLSTQYFGGYVTLFSAAAVIGLLGAVFVVKIKGWRKRGPPAASGSTSF